MLSQTFEGCAANEALGDMATARSGHAGVREVRMPTPNRGHGTRAARAIRGVGFRAWVWYRPIACGIVCVWSTLALAQAPNAGPNQPAAPQKAQGFQNAAIAPLGPVQNGFGLGGNMNNGQNGGNPQRGGAANADFDSLIDLIESTVATDTWAENGGGQAEIRPFPTGVMVDSGGMLRQKSQQKPDAESAALAAKRGKPASAASAAPQQAKRASPLRYISLPRLEREIARRQAAHQPLDAVMLTLAGLQRAQFVFAYPESGDLVIAGPAGDWYVSDDGHILSKVTNLPVVRLDDLLCLLRRGPSAADSHFGCSINPRQESLAKTQEFLAASSRRPLEPSQRKQWLSDLRDTVGRQDIEIFGIDPASRAASVLVEADYHMKLIGMGLAEGVTGVASYLDTLKQATTRAGASPPPAPPPMSVLRWWFTLNYDSIHHSEPNDAFELIGQAARVLSENELLAERGQRVHTGQSDNLNRQFAESFTANFAELAHKYPVYGELRNIFDLSMAVALIQKEGLAEKVGWKPGLLVNGDKLRLPHRNVPREVETVINHRVVNGRTILAGVSGGVMVAPSDVLKQASKSDSTGNTIERAPVPPKELAAEAWWWDAP